MSSNRLLYRGSCNFAIKREFAIPIQFTQPKLLIGLSAVRVPQATFGTLQPILFIPELGFASAAKQSLKFDKNMIEIDMQLAVNYRLVLAPYTKVKTNVNIAIYEPLYAQNTQVLSIGDNLFIGNL